MPASSLVTTNDQDQQNSCARDFTKFSYVSHGETVEIDPKILLHDPKLGEDEGKVLGYPEPFFILNETGHKKITGTFRSSYCLRPADAGTFPVDVCSLF